MSAFASTASARDKCVAGDEASCTSYANDLQATCQSGAPDMNLACSARAQCWANRGIALQAAKRACETEKDVIYCALARQNLRTFAAATACDNPRVGGGRTF
jgi:hypothetical protein